MRRIGALLAVLCASSCLWPHFEALAPSVRGELLSDGRGVSNASVWVVATLRPAEGPCEGAEVRARSRVDGSFRLHGEREFSWWFPLGEGTFAWTLGFEIDGVRSTQTFHVFGTTGPTHVRTRCEVDEQRKVHCRWGERLPVESGR